MKHGDIREKEYPTDMAHCIIFDKSGYALSARWSDEKSCWIEPFEHDELVAIERDCEYYIWVEPTLSSVKRLKSDEKLSKTIDIFMTKEKERVDKAIYELSCMNLGIVKYILHELQGNFDTITDNIEKTKRVG